MQMVMVAKELKPGKPLDKLFAGHMHIPVHIL